ncbi:hypothetical protein EVAR_37755_1 [Eumeta japonica]|uniref:Uncharacterized protein n=1 Tax=Eumeta variegata TaxID=151549 RepID=A0A4C1WLS2_EUMVA|nr:hypothetical protein EVAR_37755_1 [Eumeta japonica]
MSATVVLLLCNPAEHTYGYPSENDHNRFLARIARLQSYLCSIFLFRIEDWEMLATVGANAASTSRINGLTSGSSVAKARSKSGLIRFKLKINRKIYSWPGFRHSDWMDFSNTWVDPPKIFSYDIGGLIFQPPAEMGGC